MKFGILGSMMLVLLGGCAAPSARRFQFSQVVMGVAARVEVYALDEAAARDGASLAFARMDELDAVLSDYRPDSEAMRLCRSAGGPAVRASPDLLAVLQRSREIGVASGGAFDVTVGPMVALWREARRSGALPDAREIAAARGLVGVGLIEIDEHAGSVRLAKHGMRLDFGGIGKGYAASEAVAALRSAGFTRCLAAVGGDVAAGEAPPGRAAWRVAAPGADGSMIWITLANRAVSSSGDAEQFVEIGGKRYSHIVDPATGLGDVHRVSATVSAPDGATADALASAVSILGAEKGRRLVERFEGARLEAVADAE